eukprot:TRINITY_DN11547_c0_g3_i3.p2 TRINITY_DN11547_c0_g3~~TRINITY_DN11547_c0_g3_i3.p2  ORF type:complete len:135 (-),score=28.20 TRINITY_DN11547_c0_g3_i3:146-550(-)
MSMNLFPPESTFLVAAAALLLSIQKLSPPPPKGKKPIQPRRTALGAVSSARSSRMLGGNQHFAVIGERINPTGKKALQSELREGKFNIVRKFAQEQTEQGAAILDVNMGLSGIDEKDMMIKAIALLSQSSDLPL